MKRAKEGAGENSKPAGGGGREGLSSVLSQLLARLSWEQGSKGEQPEPWHQGREHNPTGKDTNTKRTQRKKSHIRRMNTRCMCGN